MNHAVSRTTRVRLLRMVGLLAAILCAALLLAEAGARVLVCHFAPDEAFCGCCSLRQYKKHGAGKSRLIPHPYLGFNLQPNLRRSSSTNSLGYRGKEVEVPKPPGQFRVVCLGGSTTYDDCIEDDTLTYPARLEYHLRERGYNVRVVNAGVPGWTSYESLINYAFRVSYLEPDMVILFDAWNDLSAHVVYPPSAYVSDNTGMKGAGPCVFLFYEQSMLVRIFLVGSGRVLPQLMRALNQTAPTFVEGYPHAAFFKKTSLRSVLEMNPPTYFMNNLRNIIAMAERQGAQTLLLTFPCSKTQETFAHCFGLQPSATEQFAELVWALDEMNAAIQTVAEETGALFYDLAAAFPQPADFHELYADGFHNNEAGADLKAKYIAQFLLDTASIPQQ